MRLILAVALVLLAAPTQAASPLAGVYGAVCFDPSEGKMVGARVILSGDAPRPEVVFQHCTGGCSRHTTTSAALTGDRLAFEIANRTDDNLRAQFTGRIRGNTLTLEGLTDSYGFEKQRLSKTAKCPKDTVLADP